MRQTFELSYHTARMNPDDVLGCLEAKWQNYLEERGHYIYKTGSSHCVVRSRNSNNVRYRWLLLVGQYPKRILSKLEQAYIHRHLGQAETKKRPLTSLLDSCKNQDVLLFYLLIRR